ncbi:hypothetical protein OC834_006262 [Tilletia horrida]|nr:hypothetical protein OC834_006262 [Tilletia horrida]
MTRPITAVSLQQQPQTNNTMVLFRAGMRAVVAPTCSAAAVAVAPLTTASASSRTAARGMRVGMGAAGAAGTMTAAASLFSWASSSGGSGEQQQKQHAGWTSRSGFLLREASPAMAAIKKQAYTLVFVSSPNLDADTSANSRRRWGGVLGYFQESSGYDCVDLTAGVERKEGQEGSAGDEHEELLVLADELHAQLRLAMFQRPPVLFASPPSSKILSAYIGPDTSSTPLLSAAIITLQPPAASGFKASSSATEALAASALASSSGTTASFRAPVLVVLPAYSDADHDAATLEKRVKELWGPKAELLRVASSDPHSAEAVREIERWMLSHGF